MTFYYLFGNLYRYNLNKFETYFKYHDIFQLNISHKIVLNNMVFYVKINFNNF